MPKTRGILKESNKNKQVNKKNENEIDKINTDFYSAMNYCIDLLLENGYISQTKNKNISREAARLGVHMYEKMMKMKGKMAHEADHVSDDDDDDNDNNDDDGDNENDDDDDIEIIEDDEDEHEDDITIVDDDSMSIDIDDNSVIVKEEPMDINVTNNSKTNNVINETTESTRHSTRSSKRPTKLRESFDQLNCENNEPLTTTTKVSKKRQLKSPEDIAKQDQLSEINGIVIVKCRKQIGDDRRLTNELICDWAKSAALKIKDSTFEASASWLKDFKKSNGIFVEDTI